jgi:hypothetical protein
MIFCYNFSIQTQLFWYVSLMNHKRDFFAYSHLYFDQKVSLVLYLIGRNYTKLLVNITLK